MKRTIIASILGIAASVASSYGQGAIFFSTYISSAVQATIVWGDNSPTPAPGHTLGTPIASSDAFTAELYYGLGSGLSFSALSPIAGSITPVGTILAGSITGPIVTMPDYVSGAVTFGIQVWNGPGYGLGTYQSLANGPTWTEPASSIATGSNPAGFFTVALLDAAYPNGAGGGIVPVPEPATMVLSGLGAAAMLIFRRRK